jgi:DNA-binding XRE family transcriptional regulator
MPPKMLASAVTASFKSSKPDIDVKRAKRRLTPRSATGIDAYIGARMRERRLLLEISQDRLGKELGVSLQQIQKYEAVKIASARPSQILNVSLASIFELDPKA